MNIHPTAVIDSNAMLGRDVVIGPFCIVEKDVLIADGCRLASRVVIKEGTRMGTNNRVHEGAVLGGLPQHMQLPKTTGSLEIGVGNTFRENTTVHRALHEGDQTVIGDNNLIMVGAHVGHDCQIGHHVALINNVMIAGHVTIEDRAYVAGGAAVQQFRRVGRLAAVGGYARAVKDVPPYVTLDGYTSGVVGLNRVGLQRAGYKAAEILSLKNAYRLIYRSGLPWKEILERLKADFTSGPAAEFYPFLTEGQYGFMPERRAPASATIKLYREDGFEAEEQQSITRVG